MNRFSGGYVIAIPTFKREKVLVNQTLATLRRHGSDLSNVFVFVADEGEKRVYDRALNLAGFKVPTVVGVRGLIHQRVFISKYFPEGTPTLSLDDDICGLYEKSGEKNRRPLSVSIDELTRYGFSLCKKYRARLWGIYPVLNPYFLKNTVTIGLRYINGLFQGGYAGEVCTIGSGRQLFTSGEDYENTLCHFRRYGKVVRIDAIASETKFFAAGGVEAEIGGAMERQVDHDKNLREIAARYPELCRIVKKANGVTNLRCRDITMAKEPYSIKGF